MCMVNGSTARWIGFFLSFHKDADSYSLLNIKNVLIICSIRRLLVFLTITMQIKDINLIKALHKALAHASECGIIQIAMIGNEGKDAITSAFDTPLGKANKLDIVVVQPFGVSLSERLTVNLKVVASYCPLC